MRALTSSGPSYVLARYLQDKENGMPASRAVLTDLENHGLNPLKAHKDLSDDGHLKTGTPAGVRPRLKAKKAALAAEVAKVEPPVEEVVEVIVEEEKPKAKQKVKPPARQSSRRSTSSSDDE
jgi:hypothetical protein